MKLIPVIERAKWRKIGGVTKGQRWNFDPAVDDFLYISNPEVARDLVKSGHWQELLETDTQLADSYYTLTDVLKEGAIRIFNALSEGHGEVMQTLEKAGMVAYAENAFQNSTISELRFAYEATMLCTAKQLKVFYGTPLEDFGVPQFKAAVVQEFGKDGD